MPSQPSLTRGPPTRTLPAVACEGEGVVSVTVGVVSVTVVSVTVGVVSVTVGVV